MSNHALNLLIDSGLLTRQGNVVDLSTLPKSEISSRISQYVNGRKQTYVAEIENFERTDFLNALLSTGSARTDKDDLLLSSLVYNSIVVDDPLVSSATSVDYEAVLNGLNMFSWAFDLIKAGFLKVLPLSLINRPSDSVPLLLSDDAFRSSIPTEIHDFIHQKANVKSVIEDEDGRVLILNENASKKRRTALHIEFLDDFWKSGVNLFLFQTIEKIGDNENGIITVRQNWDPEGRLDKEKFDTWLYQSINQSMRSRLANIYNESYIATKIGHTYVTESKFEASLLSMAGVNDSPKKDVAAQFLDANTDRIWIPSPKAIIELRTKHPGTFERFNFSLQQVSEELANVNEEDFARKAKLLFHSEILPQIDEVRSIAKQVRTTSTRGGLVALAGVSLAIATGTSVPLIPAMLLAGAGALTDAIPSITQSIDLKKRPAYIWHRITRK